MKQFLEGLWNADPLLLMIQLGVAALVLGGVFYVAIRSSVKPQKRSPGK
jgi:hypothetical protein